ncbi:hypothetical protein ACLK1T_03330 [Escherichia coli]
MWLCICATVSAADRSQRRFPGWPGGQDFTSAGRVIWPRRAGSPHYHRLRRRSAKGYPQAAALRLRQLTGGV